ncbi:MAG: hypothetical protein KME64_28310 [Scytonematopsis contorta HA4267-MV1]|nr:hypothetical protein [Scytonematopsis contorta HA4267-MV1]
MSNEQLMQNELATAIIGVAEVATYELSDEELKLVAGGYSRTICINKSRVEGRQRVCYRRSRRYDGGDLE